MDNILDEIVSSCRYLLNNSPEGEEYLTYLNGRLTSEMQEKFAFGFFPGAKNLKLLTAFVSEDKLKQAGLLYDYIMRDSVSARVIHTCYFEDNQLIMPYKDVYGKVVGLVGRTLLNDEARTEQGVSKYKNTDLKKGKHVFGLYEAKQSILEKDFVYVVEGQFDVIKAMEKGIYNIVALGNATMSMYQLSLICRYTKNIYLLLDNDEAGEKGRKRTMKEFNDAANLSNVYLPFGYKDIDEYLKDQDGDSLRFLAVKNVRYSL